MSTTKFEAGRLPGRRALNRAPALSTEIARQTVTSGVEKIRNANENTFAGKPESADTLFRRARFNADNASLAFAIDDGSTLHGREEPQTRAFVGKVLGIAFIVSAMLMAIVAAVSFLLNHEVSLWTWFPPIALTFPVIGIIIWFAKR